MRNRIFDGRSLDVLLDSRAWKLVSTLAEPDCPSGPLPRRARWTVLPPARHPYPEFMIVLRGMSGYVLNGPTYCARPGTVFFVRSSEPHSYCLPTPSPEYVHLWATIVGDCLTAHVVHRAKGDASRRTSAPVIVTASEMGINLRQQLTDIEDPAWPPELRRAKCLGLIRLIVLTVISKGFLRQADDTRLLNQQTVVRTMQTHLRENVEHRMTLSSLAGMVGYSKFHLLRIFRRHSGQTIHQYLNQCRIARLAEMSSSRHTQKELAAALGFSGPQAFSRWQRGIRITPPA